MMNVQIAPSHPPAISGDVVTLSNIATDFAAVLSGKSCDLINYLYRVDGRWRDVVQTDDSYTVGRSEIGLINTNKEAIKNNIPEGSVLVDLGPGDIYTVATKTFGISDAINPAAYIAVDLQEQFVEAAVEVVQTKYKKIRSTGIGMDFFNHPRYIETGLANTPITLFMAGCTLGQVPLSADPSDPHGTSVGRAFDGFAKMVGSNREGNIIVTIDTSRDASLPKEQKANACYGGECIASFFEGIIPALHMNGIGQDVLRSEDASYKPTWDATRSCIVHNLVFDKLSAPITLTVGNETHVIRPHQVIPLGVSHKWEPEQVIDVAQQHGWQPKAVLSGKNGVRGLILQHG